MATFFGEVLPVYSRAVDDDEDEEELPVVTGFSVIRWSPKAQEEMNKSGRSCIQCSVLVIAMGPAATGFTRTYLMEDQQCEVLGVICSGLGDKDINTFGQQAPTDKSCYIYRLQHKPQMLIVQCNTQVTPEQSYSWVHELFSKVCQDDLYVSALSTCLASDYKSEIAHNDLPTPFLRALKTPLFKGTPVCPYLEQPNTVTGLPAQILSYCQIHRVAAVLYTCYTDVGYVDPDTMKKFQRILKSTPIRDFVVENPNADKQLAKLMELHAQHSTLYI